MTKNSAASLHMKPGALPAATRACLPQPAPHVAPQLAPYTSAHSPPHEPSGPACSALATSLPSPANSQLTLRTPKQHLPSISSLRIARPISHARACLEPHVPPRQTVDLPRPLSPDAQPCLSNGALLVRQSAPVLMRARPQYAGHSCTCPASHAQRVGSGILARIAYGSWHSCRDTQDASVHVTGLAAVLSKPMLMSCAEHVLQLAAHMQCRHTCNAAHLVGRCSGAVDLLIAMFCCPCVAASAKLLGCFSTPSDTRA